MCIMLQRVVISGVDYEWVPVISGVPRGSVIGPALIIIYVNDVDVGLNIVIVKFSDEKRLIIRFS